LALWKIINEDAFLIPKIEARTFPADFCSRNFLGQAEPQCATPFIVALSPGNSDITRFRPWSPIATGNHLDLAAKIPEFDQITGTVDVFDLRSGIWTHFAESFRMSKSS